MAWSDEKKARLRQWAADGWTGQQIAFGLGKSRNAVCGMAHRMGVKLGNRSTFQNRAFPVGRRACAPDWLLVEDAYLRKHAADGAAAIAAVLERSVSAVSQRAAKHGVRLGRNAGKAKSLTPTPALRADPPHKGEGGAVRTAAQPCGNHFVDGDEMAGGMAFIDALFGRCRTPLDLDFRSKDCGPAMRVCGDPVADRQARGLAKSHCAACLLRMTGPGTLGERAAPKTLLALG